MKMKPEIFDVVVTITEHGITKRKMYQNINHRDLLVIFMECSEGYRNGNCDKYAITVAQD